MVEAPAPYDGQIEELRRQVGAVFIRQSMKDASGATVMDPATQVTSLHGVSMLDAAREPFEANLCLAVLRERNGPNDNALANIAIAAHVNLHGDPILAAAEAARAAGNAPNAVLADGRQHPGAAPRRRRPAGDRDAARPVPGRGPATPPTRRSISADIAADAVAARARRRTAGPRRCWQRSRRGGPGRSSCATCAGSATDVTADAVLAAHGPDAGLGAAAAQAHQPAHGAQPALVPGPLRHADRRLRSPAERHTAEASAASPTTSCCAPGPPPSSPAWRSPAGGPARTSCSPTRCCWACCSRTARARSRPRAPRVRSRPMGRRAPSGCSSTRPWSGFLTHSGFSHGGNGFEGIQFLLEQFEGQGLEDPARAGHGLDLAAMATRFAQAYKQEKAQRRELAADGARAIPGINHPVFRGKPVNTDPREAFVAELMRSSAASATSSTTTTAPWCRRSTIRG